MPSWQGKSKGGTLGYRIFIAVLKLGGVSTAYFLLRVVTLYYLLFSFKSTKYTYKYFRERHNYGVFRSIFNVYQNYNLLGQALIDKVVVIAGIPNKLTFHLDGVENLRNIANSKQGGLLLTTHIGNWEAASHLLGELDSPINVVIFDGEDEGIKEYLDSVTGKSPIKYIVLKDDMSHIFQISEAFLDGEIVCMPADRFLEGNKTLTTKFLGAEAKFPAGPFMLASRFKVPVSFVCAVKETAFHYHFFGSQPKEYLYLDKEATVQEIFTDFIDYFEVKVKKYPEQWYNYYNFWQ
jgi:predicted LPLAT superfamily acyltransferase